MGNSSLYETYFYTVLIFFPVESCLFIIKEIKHQEILCCKEMDMVLSKIPWPLWVLVFSFTK